MGTLWVGTWSSDLYWTASMWVGGVTLSVTLLLLIVLFALKLLEQSRLRLDRRFDQVWHPLLVQAALGDTVPAQLPPLRPGDDWRLLKLWVRFQATLKGASQERLRQLGWTLRCGQWARTWLDSPHRSEQIFGILCLGYLRDESAWEPLAARMQDASNSVFIYAAWALLQLAPDRAPPVVVDQLMRRRDLNVLQASTVLRPFRSCLDRELTPWLPQATSAQASGDKTAALVDVGWWLRLGWGLGMKPTDDRLSPWLDADQPMDVIIGALRLLQGPGGLPAVRTLVAHPDWQVRTQVAVTLGRLGMPQDQEHLMQLLMDAQWWVRYRAAQALASTPFMSRRDLQARVAQLPDRYAREMAQQVFLEIPVLR